MSWTSEVPRIVEALAKKRGRYDERTPKMTATDMVGTLGLYSSALPTLIRRVADAGCQPSSNVTPDGAFIAPNFALPIAQAISAEDYLFRSVGKIIAWRRTPTSSGLELTYEPARSSHLLRNDQLELIAFLRQTITDYQRALNQCAYSSTTYFGTVADADTCKLFMSAIRALAADLEVLSENPPTSFNQDVKGALGAALDASEQATVQIADAAGNAAAWVGNAAGKVAGAAAGGFLDKANLATIVVAAVVGYVAVGKVL